MISNTNVHITPPLPTVSPHVATYLKTQCTEIMKRNFPDRVPEEGSSTLASYAWKVVSFGVNRTVQVYGVGTANRVVEGMYRLFCPPPGETKKSWYHALWNNAKKSAWATGLVGAQLALSPVVLSALGKLAPVAIQLGGTALAALLDRYFGADKNFIQALEQGDFDFFSNPFELRNLQGEPMDARARKLFLRDLLRYDMMEKFSNAPVSKVLKQHPVLSQYCFSTDPEAYEVDGSLNLSFDPIYFRDGHRVTPEEKKILGKGLQAINTNANYAEEAAIDQMLTLLAKHEEKSLRDVHTGANRADGYLALQGEDGCLVALKNGPEGRVRAVKIGDDQYLREFFVESEERVFFRNGEALRDRELEQYAQLKDAVQKDGGRNLNLSVYTKLLSKARSYKEMVVSMHDGFERMAQVGHEGAVVNVPVDENGEMVSLGAYKRAFYITLDDGCYSYAGEKLFEVGSEAHAQLDSAVERSYKGDAQASEQDLFFLNVLAAQNAQVRSGDRPHVEIAGRLVNVKDGTVMELRPGGVNALLVDGCVHADGKVYAADDVEKQHPLSLEAYRGLFGVHVRKEDGSEWIFPLKSYAEPLWSEWVLDAFQGEPLTHEQQLLLNQAYKDTAAAKTAPSDYYWFPRAGNKGGRYYYPATNTLTRTHAGAIHVALRDTASCVSNCFWRRLGYKTAPDNAIKESGIELQSYPNDESSVEDNGQ